MVRVKFTFRNGTTRIANFPRATMADLRHSARGINPRIVKIEFAPRRR